MKLKKLGKELETLVLVYENNRKWRGEYDKPATGRKSHLGERKCGNKEIHLSTEKTETRFYRLFAWGRIELLNRKPKKTTHNIGTQWRNYKHTENIHILQKKNDETELKPEMKEKLLGREVPIL